MTYSPMRTQPCITETWSEPITSGVKFIISVSSRICLFDSKAGFIFHTLLLLTFAGVTDCSIPSIQSIRSIKVIGIENLLKMRKLEVKLMIL